MKAVGKEACLHGAVARAVLEDTECESALGGPKKKLRLLPQLGRGQANYTDQDTPCVKILGVLWGLL